MDATRDLLVAFEGHAPERIRAALAAGASPVEPIDGRRPVDLLIEMYTRSAAFPACLRAMIEAGATVDDPRLEAVLLDDAPALAALLDGAPQLRDQPMSLACAYTSLNGASPLHVCAEYNSVACAGLLIERGADVDAQAAVDGEGRGGQTPLFHAVNSNGNHCRPVMELLAEAGASLEVRVPALTWGGGFDWETTVFDVTPISYAQCGLYAQFHRREQDVYSNITYLYGRRHGREAPVRNVPNRYLR